MHHLLLQKGNYLAPVYSTLPLANMLVGITEYPSPVETGVWHSHERSLLSFVIKGRNLENRTSAQIERGPGHVGFYHIHEPHQNIYLEFPSKHISIELDHNFYKQYDLTESAVLKAVNKSPDTIFLFSRILKEMMLSDEASKVCIEMMVLDLIHTAATEKDHSGSWVSKVHAMLREHWNEPFSLSDLSRESGAHPVTISKEFRKYFSCTVGEFSRKLKVEKALMMMKSGKQPLTDIGYVCGFADQSHFIRCFKEFTGFLPKEYRKV